MNKKNLFHKKINSQRQQRVQEILRSALNEILIRGESKSHFLDESILTITYVDISPDLRNARFMFIPQDLQQIDKFLSEFNLVKKVIRKKIAEKVQLKYVPEISFCFDESINEREKIEKILSSKKVMDDIKS